MKEFAYIHEEGKLPEVLENVPFFKQFSASHLNDILYSSYFIECGAGEAVVREGDDDQRVFVLLEGTVEITRNNSFIARLSTPGEVFGELAIIRNAPRTATVTALTPILCLVIDQQFLQELKPMATNEGYYAALYGFLCKLLASRLHAASVRLAALEQEMATLRAAGLRPVRATRRSTSTTRLYQRSAKTSRKK